MLSILLATTGRPQMALETLESIVQTTGQDMEYVVAVDCDEATRDTVREFLASTAARFIVDYREEHRGCSRAWNDALNLSSGDLLVLAADDLIFHKGWLEAALEKMAELPEGGGLVGFNDTQTDGNMLATHYMLSRWFIDNCLGGKIAWEHYQHSFNDMEITERAKGAGRFIHAPEAVVEHRHWIFGTRPQDTTDTRNLVGHSASARNYNERAAAGFPD